jgi:hypothetical protein
MYARSYPLDYVRHRSVKSQRNYTKTYHCLSSCNPVLMILTKKLIKKINGLLATQMKPKNQYLR